MYTEVLGDALLVRATNVGTTHLVMQSESLMLGILLFSVVALMLWSPRRHKWGGLRWTSIRVWSSIICGPIGRLSSTPNAVFNSTRAITQTKAGRTGTATQSPWSSNPRLYFSAKSPMQHG